jgi:hypothetical protein
VEARQVRKAGWLLAGIVWSWALVAAADARHERKPVEVAYQVVTVEVEPEVRVPAPTPIADSLVDWEELERDTDCLWVILQEHFGWDITMERVTAGALWTHELGGACYLIGEDDE